MASKTTKELPDPEPEPEPEPIVEPEPEPEPEPEEPKPLDVEVEVTDPDNFEVKVTVGRDAVIDWTDGSPLEKPEEGEATHRYNASGTYHIVATAEDDGAEGYGHFRFDEFPSQDEAEAE